MELPSACNNISHLILCCCDFLASLPIRTYLTFLLFFSITVTEPFCLPAFLWSPPPAQVHRPLSGAMNPSYLALHGRTYNAKPITINQCHHRDHNSYIYRYLTPALTSPLKPPPVSRPLPPPPRPTMHLHYLLHYFNHCYRKITSYQYHNHYAHSN